MSLTYFPRKKEADEARALFETSDELRPINYSDPDPEFTFQNLVSFRKVNSIENLTATINIVSAEINQGRKLFKGGNYSKEETINF